MRNDRPTQCALRNALIIAPLQSKPFRCSYLFHIPGSSVSVSSSLRIPRGLNRRITGILTPLPHSGLYQLAVSGRQRTPRYGLILVQRRLNFFRPPTHRGILSFLRGYGGPSSSVDIPPSYQAPGWKCLLLGTFRSYPCRTASSREFQRRFNLRLKNLVSIRQITAKSGVVYQFSCSVDSFKQGEHQTIAGCQ